MSNVERAVLCDEKLAELILHIARESEGDEPFGMVKLSRLLFFIDFQAYAHFGSSITGQQYQKLEHGPSPMRLPPVMKSLEMSGSVVQRNESRYDRPKQRTIALREADLAIFNGAEIALVNQILRRFRGKSARYMSEPLHRLSSLRLIAMGQEIPYQFAVAQRRRPTNAEFDRARTFESELLEGLARVSK